MKEVFIVGGGPSLKGFDFTRLLRRNTIVINKAIFNVPSPDYFITHDLTFFKKINIKEFMKVEVPKFFVLCPVTFPYTEITPGPGRNHPRIYDKRPYPKSQSGYDYDLTMLDGIIISRIESGIGIRWDDFRHGENSGFSALQFAVLMGFNPIYLLGFDMRVDVDTAHWHEGYGEDPACVQKRLDYYIHNFWLGTKELVHKAPWVKVYSCGVSSRLNKFLKYKDFEEVL